MLRCGGAAPDDPALARRLLLPADDPRRLHEHDVGRPGRVLRPGADRRDVHRRGRGRRDRQRQHLRPGRRGLDPGRRQGASGWRRGCGWARSGSTTTTPTSPQAEWGGYKQSGVGRELGLAGLDEYRETKHVWHNIRPAEQRWFRAEAGERDGQGPVRRRHRRRWLGRLRARQPALRRPRHQRPGARGRPLGLEDRPLHPHAGRAAVPDRQPLLRLALRDRPRAAPERPPGLPRPRQGARRLARASTG